MGLPYSWIRLMEDKEPYLNKHGRLPKAQANFLMRSNHMKGMTLGYALDSCRWGSPTTVRYEMTIGDMISFIENWMQQNGSEFPRLFHEKGIDELYIKFELPHIKNEVCPRNKEHVKTIQDRAGRIRCVEITKKRFKPGYVDEWDEFDKLSAMKRRVFSHHYLENDLPSDEELWTPQEDQKFKQYIDAEETEVVEDPCYAILSDETLVLPFETVLKRLNIMPETYSVWCGIGRCKPSMVKQLSPEERKDYEIFGTCRRHDIPTNQIEFPCDGWDLAFYTQKWFEQIPNGGAPLFEKQVA